MFQLLCHSVSISCWIKQLLTYLLTRGETSRQRTDKRAKRPSIAWPIRTPLYYK